MSVAVGRQHIVEMIRYRSSDIAIMVPLAVAAGMSNRRKANHLRSEDH